MTREEYEARFRAIRDGYLEAMWDYEDNGELEDAQGCRDRMAAALKDLRREYEEGR